MLDRVLQCASVCVCVCADGRMVYGKYTITFFDMVYAVCFNEMCAMIHRNWRFARDELTD